MTVVLVRHTEPAGGSDPALSTAGTRRADALAKMLADAGITAIFTSELRRTKATAAPLAALRSIAPVEIASDFTAAAAQVVAAGTRVLVVGHTDTVPQIIEALGGPSGLTIKPTEFSRMFVLHVPAAGDESLLAVRYGG